MNGEELEDGDNLHAEIEDLLGSDTETESYGGSPAETSLEDVSDDSMDDDDVVVEFQLWYVLVRTDSATGAQVEQPTDGVPDNSLPFRYSYK